MAEGVQKGSNEPEKPPRAKGKPYAHLDALKKPFLDEYEKTENQTMSCERVGISWDRLQMWKKDPAFMKQFTRAHFRAQQKNNDLLRTSLIQRAIRGSPHYLIKNGDFVRDAEGQRVVAYYDQEPQLTLFVAKNRLPDEFRDKFEFEITGQIVKMLITEFFGILRRRLTPNQIIPIQMELETMTAKLVNQ